MVYMEAEGPAMNKQVLLDEVLKLEPADRLEVMDILWESLDPQDHPPVSDEVLEEAERRIDEHERDPGSAIPWEDVRTWLWSRRK
jgi:putative addiction module component (TIGR02574 family)